MMFMRDFVRRCGDTYRNKAAYIDDDRSYTWSEVATRSKKLAGALLQLGVRKGDVVAILAEDHIEAIEHFFACTEIGAIRVGINRGYAPREMAHVIRDSNAKVVIVEGSYRKALAEYLPQFEEEERILVGLGEGHGFTHDYATLRADGNPDFDPPPLAGDDPIAISYTSGTTGFPKGVIFKQSGVRDMSIYFIMSVRLRHEDVWLNPTAMAWATVILNVMGAVNGMTTVLSGGDFKADRFLSMCSRNRVTSVVVVPVMLQRLIAAVQAQPSAYDLSSLRLVSYGSAPASPSLIRSAISVMGVELCQLYGLTECCAWATYLHHEDHLRALSENEGLLKSCGKPGLNCDVSVRDADGVPVKRGEMGELWVRASTNMLGYHNLPELTASTLNGEWLKTHDIAWQDPDGYVYLTDRKNFLIITGAANVYPSIVENTICSHPAVREAAVVGAPHPEWGEAVVAMVALRSEGAATAEDIIAYCHGKVAKWEVPKFVEIVPDIPKGPTMKVLKKQIRERYKDTPSLLPWSQQA